MLDDALRRAELMEFPENAEAMVFFATGPLHEAVEAALGESAASTILVALGPILDEAWVRERRRVATEAAASSSAPPEPDAARRMSGVRRQVEPDDESPTDIEQLLDGDTTPVPTGGAAEAAAAELALQFSTPPQMTISETPPSSNRLTVPYLPNALLPSGRTAAVVVADLDDDRRGELGDWLHELDCLVARAANREQVRSLVRKLRPKVLIADVETLAPDFEPLRPTLDDLLPGLTKPAVILVSDGAARELPDDVVTLFRRPVVRDELLARVATLVSDPSAER